MSIFDPNSRHLWEALIFCFHLKKIALSERTCRESFQRFKSGDFDVEDRHHGGKDKIFEDSKLESLLAEDSCQTQEELAKSLEVTQKAVSKRLKSMGMIQKQGN